MPCPGHTNLDSEALLSFQVSTNLRISMSPYTLLVNLQWHLQSPGNEEIKIKLLPRPDSTHKLHMILLLKLCEQLTALLFPFLDSGNLQLGMVFMWPIWSSVLNTLSICIHKQKVDSFYTFLSLFSRKTRVIWLNSSLPASSLYCLQILWQI